MVDKCPEENHRIGENILGSDDLFVWEGSGESVKSSPEKALLRLVQGAPRFKQPQLFLVLCKFALAWQAAGGIRDLIDQCGGPLS